MPARRVTRCEHSVWNQEKGKFVLCGGPAIRKIDGKYYCRHHDPIMLGEQKKKVIERQDLRMKAQRTKAQLRIWKEYHNHPQIGALRAAFQLLQEALQELVELKTIIKEKNPVTYEKRKPEAWEAARQSLVAARHVMEQVQDLDARAGVEITLDMLEEKEETEGEE